MTTRAMTAGPTDGGGGGTSSSSGGAGLFYFFHFLIFCSYNSIIQYLYIYL
jgi:hypothetical protein